MSTPHQSKEPAGGSRAAPDADPGAELAPWWHTGALVGVIVAVAATGVALRGTEGAPATPGTARPGVVSLYGPTLLVQVGLAFYVARVGRSRSVLRSLVGRTWPTARVAATDVVLALLGWLLLYGGELLWHVLGAPSGAAAASAILPRTWPERLVWSALALIIAASEELVYRGYLQRQLGALTGRAWLAVTLQATLFGVAHLEQGPAVATRVAFYAVGLGALAHWRKSLLPGMLCHAFTDVASGWL